MALALYQFQTYQLIKIFKFDQYSLQLQQTRQESAIMPNIFCGTDNSCPFLYTCNTVNNTCSHNPLLPLQVYPTIIYLLFPLCSALCNLTGTSFGQFKVLLLMDALNYTQNKSTTLTYPLIAGTGLINFFLLIPKRHPTRNTSLVDFNVILILIPNVLFGSTIGSFVNQFIPDLAADILIFLVFLGFSFKFYFIWMKTREQVIKDEKQQGQQLGQKTDRVISIKPLNEQHNISVMPQQIVERPNTIPVNLPTNQKEFIQTNKQQQKLQKLNQQKVFNPYQKQLDQKLKYESGYHLPQVIGTLIVFSIFQFISFTAQGKIKAILDIKVCSGDYFIGLGVLAAAYFVYVIGFYFYTAHNMRRYRRIKYQYNGDLDVVCRYIIVCLSGVLGGFCTGLIGLGSSTVMIFGLLILGFETVVVANTVGFQVFFSGAASMAQALVLDQISVAEAGFFFGQTFILGGVITIVARWYVEKLNLNKVNFIYLSIITFFCFVNIVAALINIVIGVVEFGITFMVSIQGC